MKYYWNKCYEYQRILEILKDYWLTEKDEFRVRVSMDFIKADGQTQSKDIRWENPNYTSSNHEESSGSIELKPISASDLLKKTDYELFKEEKEAFFNVGKIIKKEEI